MEEYNGCSAPSTLPTLAHCDTAVSLILIEILFHNTYKSGSSNEDTLDTNQIALQFMIHFSKSKTSFEAFNLRLG